MDDELYHVGTPHEGNVPHSGRYEWGSGDRAYQHPKDFVTIVESMKRKGLSEKEIRQSFGMTAEEYRNQKSLGKMQRRTEERAILQKLIDDGIDNTSERARILSEKVGRHVGESTVRLLENDQAVSKDERRRATADVLRKAVDEKTFVDIGFGVASSMGITDDRLKNAVTELKNEGYEVNTVKVPQANNPSQFTTLQVLCPKANEWPVEGKTTPQERWRYLKDHVDQVQLINEKFADPKGKTLLGIEKPKKLSSKRLEIIYGEEGAKKDGIIELRPGVKDLDLGNNHYAQVRINVDDTHYIKGVAVYNKNLPDGVDVRFNSNKKDTGNKLDALKAMKTVDGEKGSPIDWDNPFGSTIKKGGQKGVLNICSEEGDWQEWSKTLSSQFLSKQSTALAKQQLGLSKKEMEAEYKEIISLTNPTIKKALLEEFGDKCDTAAMHLKAAAMPGQSNSVILPVNSLKENEVYAPNYKNGTSVVLVRHPHGGTFEIPVLKVNNRNKEAQEVIGKASDAIGIHHKVAAQLSGADFDGDTVIVIPNDHRKVKATAALKELQDFDTKSYKLPPGGKVISEKYKQEQMGVISNLITDMTIQGAPPDHIIRAVKHSMVIIDAKKHELDYKQSAKDNGISELHRIYQGKSQGGASTIISRAKSPIKVPLRGQRKAIDSATGKRLYFTDEKHRYWVDKEGNTRERKTESRKMLETDDAFTLVSNAYGGKGTPMERIYAEYANSMKSLGNKARKESVSIKAPKKDPLAAKKYEKEVQSLTDKLVEAKAYRPKERQAQIYANHIFNAKYQDNPDMTEEQQSKVRRQALEMGRQRVGGKRITVTFTDKEWEAVQNNAISPTRLSDLVKYADSDHVKKLAMPKQTTALSTSEANLAKARLKAGYSYEEVARMFGVSRSTIQRLTN